MTDQAPNDLIHVSRRNSDRHTAFTLLETIVVVAIVSVLMALMTCAIQRTRAAGARAACAGHLRQLGLAIHAYADVHRQFPEGCAYPFSYRPYYAGLSWHTLILPYMEQEPLWAWAWKVHSENPVGETEAHGEVQKQTVPLFMCPSEPRRPGGYTNGIFFGLTSYQGVAGTRVGRNDGIFHRNYRVKFADVTDGTSNTIMVGERPPGRDGKLGAWFAGWGYSVCKLSQILPAGRTTPRGSLYEARDCDPYQSSLGPGVFESDCDLNHFWSMHLGGANFAFADCSVRFMPYSASAIMPALATRAGGEAVAVPD